MSDENNPVGNGWNARPYDGRHAFVWRQGAALVELLAPEPGEHVLNIGCGSGHLTAQIAAGATVLGLDSSPEMIAEARRAHPDLRFKVGDDVRHVHRRPVARPLQRRRDGPAVGRRE